ncbi:Cyclic nucleotide-gated cation channel [Papilio xuthus]|uniref:Cyclic nucleotide-gated cation channel n=1 Tax=Papilio xuthus TaxID=66420 RepID=A0A194PZA9_PAPXU|nr:Cyclic nucleotide-gated cation channel [Papilio xuthus]
MYIDITLVRLSIRAELTEKVCVTSGVLELLSDEDDESPMISFSKGTCFGEIALIFNIPARCTVKAATYVECQILRKTEFTKLMITYPDLIGEIRKDILKRIARSRVRKENQTGDDQFLLNIYVSKDRKKSSIKCLKDKLRYRQATMYYDDYREHLFYLFKGTKLCLVWRLTYFFEKLERKLLSNSILIKIAKYCTFVSLLCYWCGVILYMESCFVARCSQNSWFARAITENIQKPVAIQMRATKTQLPLITSIYFSTTLLLSVGYGDFSPGDKHDMGLVAFLSLFGVLLTGYCISEFSSVVTHWSRTKTAFLEVIITIDKFMRENNMHRAIKSRIMAFYELQWQYNSGVELTDQSWLDTTVVPSELRRKVLHQARFKALTSIKFFQVKNKAYIQTLTGMARDVILPPGEIVYYGGTIPRELYIIERGYCLVTSKAMREEKKERVVGPGNHLGLLVMLYGVPAVNTVLISISHVAYTSALNLFPDMREHDGLLTPEELKMIADQAKLQSAEAYFQHYNVSEKAPKMKITSFLQDFLDSSWLDEAKTFKVKNLTPAKAYLLAYYWSATSFSGAGFGDIIAQDTTHMVLSICVTVHGFLFFGYVYARMASLKAMADQMVTNFQENVKHLELFLNREKVAFTLKRTIIDYWKYQWKRTGGWSHQTILGKLHSNLNEDAVLYMYEKTLREIPLFENVEYSFFRSFAKQLQEQYYQKGYMVIRANEVVTSMYIIYRGKVDIISESNEVEACMGPGGIFGNIRGASRYLTQSNVVASRNIDLLCIPGTEFYSILKGYPSVLRKVKESFSSTTKDYVLSTIMSERTSVEHDCYMGVNIITRKRLFILQAFLFNAGSLQVVKLDVQRRVEFTCTICRGLLISEMSAMITAHSSSRIAYDYQINELKDGLRDTDLSDHQMNKMWDYVCELWNRQQGRQMPELVYKLPFRLRCQVMQAVYGSHIRESVIFEKTDDDFKRMLVMWMKHCVFFPGNYIVQRGDSDQCIYFIHRGEVEVLTVHPNLTESIYDVLGPEDSFGIAQASAIISLYGFQYAGFQTRTRRTMVSIGKLANF